VKFLLDENFPLPLYHRLKSSGCEVEHIIVLGQRGLPDSAILRRLAHEDLVFLTCDLEFVSTLAVLQSAIIVSRVSQNLPIACRVEIWFTALKAFRDRRPSGKIFELLDSGEIVPFQIEPGSR
jgi:predicted nuclease of predicted toxin-antitoxin system